MHSVCVSVCVSGAQGDNTLLPTRSREGPGSCTVALIQWLVDFAGPILAGVEVAREVVGAIHFHLKGPEGSLSSE